MKDLDVSLRTDLNRMFQEARALFNNADLNAGVELAESAWNRLPEPKFDWDVSKSYVNALAGICRDASRFDKAIDLMTQLFKSGSVKAHQDRPRFMMGTIYFEMGNLSESRRWFIEANSISKGRCFEQEPPKYRQLIEQ